MFGEVDEIFFLLAGEAAALEFGFGAGGEKFADEGGSWALAGKFFAEATEENVGDGRGDLLRIDGFAEKNEMIPARMERAGADGIHDAAENRVFFEMAAGGGPIDFVHSGMMVCVKFVTQNPDFAGQSGRDHGQGRMRGLTILCISELPRRSWHASAVET